VGRSVPVALAGRIPVKVSAENGRVKAGDFLTASSIPGVAMKATKAGPIIGQALQDFSYLDNDIGLIVAFVKTSYFTGKAIQDEIAGLSVQQQLDDGQEEALSSLSNSSNRVLEYLMAQQAGITSSAAPLSEIVTDRIAAGLAVISPQITTNNLAVNTITAATGHNVTIDLTDGELTIGKPGQQAAVRIDEAGNAFFAGTVTAGRIEAAQIVGLEVVYGKLTELTEQVAQLETVGTSTNAITTDSPVTTPTLTGTVNEIAAAPIAIQDGALANLEKVIFEDEATFTGTIVFEGDIFFAGRPVFNADTAGFAKIKEGDSQVEITFEKEYGAVPVVNANMTFDEVVLPDGTIQDPIEQETQVLVADMSYIVSRRTTKGFTIVLNKPAVSDLSFSWVAIAVKDAKTFESPGLYQGALKIEESTTEVGTTEPEPGSNEPATTNNTEAATSEPILTPSPSTTVVDAAVPTVSPAPKTQGTLTILGNQFGEARLREQPNASSVQIAELQIGQTYEYYAVEGSWYQIRLPDARLGWVSSDQVAAVANPQTVSFNPAP
jgi:hypothetical protein